MSALEQRLVALGRELDVPDAPDVAPRVLVEIAARPPVARRRPRRLVFALAVVVLAALVATLAIPDARSALLRFLQIGGARIELVDELPPVPQTPPELELALGERVPLAEARSRTAFELLELEDEPDAVYLGERGTVWFLYGGPDEVRLLLAQTPRVAVDETFILKKLAGQGTTVEPLTVRGERAYFVSGEPHVVALLDANGAQYEESARLARDVLVWDEDGRTVRIEGDLSKDQALAVAGSLR